jgi:hypothetical protein
MKLNIYVYITRMNEGTYLLLSVSDDLTLYANPSLGVQLLSISRSSPISDVRRVQFHNSIYVIME